MTRNEFCRELNFYPAEVSLLHLNDRDSVLTCKESVSKLVEKLAKLHNVACYEQLTVTSTRWQPIGTAPLDGTEVLLRFPEGTVIQGKYPGALSGWQVVWLPSHGCGCCSAEDPVPTHWMPLPEEP